MPELKKCPFCNGKAKIVGGPEEWTPTLYDPDSGGDPYQIQCTKCDVYMGFYDEPEVAIEAWNRRAGDAE